MTAQHNIQTMAGRNEAQNPLARPLLQPGLSVRLLLLTIAFVMLAEILIYVPSIANFRYHWLNDRIAAAQTAALALQAAPAGTIPPALEKQLLKQVGAVTVAVRSGGARRLLTISDMPPMASHETDLRSAGALVLIANAFSTLAATEPRFIRVVGAGNGLGEFVEIVMDETPLRAAMLAYSVNILLLSLLISGITAGLVYLALHRLIVRPVRRLTSAIMAFAANPDDASRIIAPGTRSDEIGLAERALENMQISLAGTLRERKHLAALGMAVSKINHDLRNMLASAQLFTDRIASIADPTVQRLGPRLIDALDRAIGFASATLAYGAAVEPAPRRAMVRLRPLVDDVGHMLGLGPEEAVRLAIDIPDDLVVDADAGQLSRVLVNLGRNALAAMASIPAPAQQPVGHRLSPSPPLSSSSLSLAPHTLTISARRHDDRVEIIVSDTGPGVPPRARAHLFEAFSGSSTPGGTGLGLAIASELITAHGGDIQLQDTRSGASFRLTIPDRPGS